MPHTTCLLLVFALSILGLSVNAQPDLSPWTAKFIVTHPNGVDSDTVWFGCDTAGGLGYQPGLDVIDTNFNGRIRILAYDEKVEADSGFGTCVNLRRTISNFKTGITKFEFYVLSDSVSLSSGVMATLTWDTTDFRFANDSFSLDGAVIFSEYGYINFIDQKDFVISDIQDWDSSYVIESGPINLLPDGIPFECNSSDPIIKLTIWVVFNIFDLGNGLRYPEIIPVSAFPNPSSDFITLNIGRTISIGSLSIFNEGGMLSFAKNVFNSDQLTIDLGTGFPNGFYIAQILDRENRVIYITKFIVSH